METPYQPPDIWSSQAPSTSALEDTHMLSASATKTARGLNLAEYIQSRSESSSAGLLIPSIPSVMPTSSHSIPALSRSLSPSSPDLRAYGIPNKNGTWSCAYPGCESRAVFTRGCDLRKHHKRHTKSFFCRHPDCPESTGDGFSSKKDLARHEAKHNPGVPCEWEGCDRVFSRIDNMRDHVKRIHHKAYRFEPPKQDQPLSPLSNLSRKTVAADNSLLEEHLSLPEEFSTHSMFQCKYCGERWERPLPGIKLHGQEKPAEHGSDFGGSDMKWIKVNPADQNPPCNTLYVGNLPMDASEDELKTLFSKQRGYKRLCFRAKRNGPMCFVEFEDTSFATKAMHELYGYMLHNSVKDGIRLSFSKNPLGVRSGQNFNMDPPSAQAHERYADALYEEWLRRHRQCDLRAPSDALVQPLSKLRHSSDQSVLSMSTGGESPSNGDFTEHEEKQGQDMFSDSDHLEHVVKPTESSKPEAPKPRKTFASNATAVEPQHRVLRSASIDPSFSAYITPPPSSIIYPSDRKDPLHQLHASNWPDFRNTTNTRITKSSSPKKRWVGDAWLRKPGTDAVSDQCASSANSLRFITASTPEDLRSEENMTIVRNKAMENYLADQSYPSPMGSSVSLSNSNTRDWEHPQLSLEACVPVLLSQKSNYQNLLDGSTVPGVTYPTSLSTNLTSKRTSQKIAEQGRRNRINLALKEIQSLVPSPNVDLEQRLSKIDEGSEYLNNSKATIIEKAVEYIKQLKEEAREREILLNSRDEEIAELRSRSRSSDQWPSKDDLSTSATHSSMPVPNFPQPAIYTEDLSAVRTYDENKEGIIPHLFQACLDSIGLMVKHFESDGQLKTWKRDLNVLKRSIAQLKLWADGYGVWNSRLHTILAQSTHLRPVVLSVLNSICKSLLDGLRAQEISHSRHSDAKLQDRMTEFYEHNKKSLSAMEDVDASDSESDDDEEDTDSDELWSFDQMVEDIKTYTDCLIDLGTALQSPVADHVSLEVS